MQMHGEHRIEASREAVWAALNDPEMLRQSIPGCESLDKISDTEFKAKVTSKVGPVSIKFAAQIMLSELDPPNGYTISGEGKGGPAGSAKGAAKVRLETDGDATILSYDIDAKLGGKLAQLGSRMIDATAKKMAGIFFGKLAELIVPVEESLQQEEVDKGFGPLWWGAGLAAAAVVIALILY